MSAHTRGLVPALIPATSPLMSLHQGTGRKGLIPGTVHTKRFEEQVVGTSPKNLNWFEFLGLVAGTNVGLFRF